MLTVFITKLNAEIQDFIVFYNVTKNTDHWANPIGAQGTPGPGSRKDTPQPSHSEASLWQCLVKKQSDKAKWGHLLNALGFQGLQMLHDTDCWSNLRVLGVKEEVGQTSQH
jgi:hypothetical protein